MANNNKVMLFLCDQSIVSPILRSQGFPLLRELAKRGWRCHVISLEDRLNLNLQCQIRKFVHLYPGVEFHAFRLPRWPKWFGVPWNFQKIIFFHVIFYRWVQRFPDLLIHSRSYFPTFGCLLIRRFYGGKLIFDHRGLVIEEHLQEGLWTKSGLIEKLMRWLLKQALLTADHVVTVSNRATKYLSVNYNVPMKKMTTIPNSFDPNRFLLDQAIDYNSNRTMVYLGGVKYWQNPKRIGEASEFYLNLIPDSKVKIFSYENPDTILAQISDKNRPRLIYDKLSPDVVPYHLSNASFGVIFRDDDIESYRSDICSPIKFAEYLICGLPVIVQDRIGDVSDLVEREGIGQVFHPGIDSLELLLIKMDKMITKGGKNLREKCQATARKYFALHNAVDAYEAIYCLLMD